MPFENINVDNDQFVNMSSTQPDRICFFLQELDVGGAEKVLINLANYFARNSYSVEFVLGDSNGKFTDQLSSSIQVIDLNASWCPFYDGASSLPGLIKYLTQSEPDILVSGMDHMNIVAVVATLIASTNTKTLLTVHNTLSKTLEEESRFREVSLVTMLKVIYPLSDAVVCCSHGVQKDLQSILPVQDDLITTIYNPVYTDELVNQIDEEVTHEWFRDPDVTVITGLSNLTPQKDYQTFLRALKKVNETSDEDIRAYIMGDGPERKDLEELSKNLRLSEASSLPGVC